MNTRAEAAAGGIARGVPDRLLEGAWTVVRGRGPVVAVAIHDGHDVREPVRAHMVLSEAERGREEDPFTGPWTKLAPTRVVVHRSRFEVDLNRPLEGAVYPGPEQAWGLRVWRDGSPPPAVVREGRRVHQAFYTMFEALLREIESEWGRFVVYDLHSYNHRRSGPRAPPEDPRRAPDVNVGTGSMDRVRWCPVVEAFVSALQEADVLGRKLDVRENVRFLGGYLPEWVHRTFPRTGCALAVEVKKFYMDEWTGDVEPSRLEAVGTALERTVPRVMEALLRPS